MIRAAAFALVVLSAGAVADGPHQVSHSGFGAYEASLTPLRDGYAVAWYDTRDGHPEIYARLLDQEGRAAGPERRLTRGKNAAYEPDVAASGDTLVVGWKSYFHSSDERGASKHACSCELRAAARIRRARRTRSECDGRRADGPGHRHRHRVR